MLSSFSWFRVYHFVCGMFIILFVVSFARLREVFFACKRFEENFAGRGDLTSFNSPF